LSDEISDDVVPPRRAPARAYPPESEWLETDGSGGFASGTVGLPRSRRYHALLLTATNPPAGRVLLVNGLEAWIDTAVGRYPISSQKYSPDVVSPDGASRVESFDTHPWPRWTFRIDEELSIEQEVFVSRVTGATVVSWRGADGPCKAKLSVRLLFSGRDYHSLHHENPSFRFEPRRTASLLTWHPYPDLPEVFANSNATYDHDPVWYRRFLYEEERARGLDFTEDLASPGVLEFDLSQSEAVLLLSSRPLAPEEDPLALARRLRGAERRRRRLFPNRLHRAADDYLVRRGRGKTVVAGYPWFVDWGRDTFISLRGLCLTTGRLVDAREILLEWSGQVSEGMLPNRFRDQGDTPEYNSVDASLWFVVAALEYLAACDRIGRRVAVSDRRALTGAVDAILEGYSRGTRYGIRADSDGLLAAGVPGVQLTWMDAKVGDWVVTPRIGKPVEIQALWINALRLASSFSFRWDDLAQQARDSFHARFWNEEKGCLFDVVDCDHVPGTADQTFRPNQIFSVGGLPFPLLEGERARRVVDAVEDKLLTPLGLRSLSPDDAAYAGRYTGGVLERDGAYHQGTVWPFLAGPFVEAWLRVREVTPAVRREARTRFLEPLLAHLKEAGLGHISEIADGDPPHTPRGCPFQAWSVGEAIRIDRLLADK
jgi:predicted glycogen debranching enzyme